MKTSNILIKNAKWKTFLFFLFLASLFWLLTKISKEFSAPVTSNIVFVNVPEDLSIKQVNTKEVTFNLYSTGYDFFGYKLKKPNLLIDVSKFSKRTKSSIIITSEQLVKEINEQFPSIRATTSINIEQLKIEVDPIIRKKVPIVLKKQISYKKGFKQIGDITLTPDSVFVSGPQKEIMSIENLLTEPLVVDLLDTNIEKEILLLSPDFVGVTLSEKSITASWTVKEIAQKSFDIPVSIINKPDLDIIKIIPNKINIRVDVTLDHYNDITANDFNIICDYSTRNKDENFMVPHLEQLPKWAEHVEFGTQKIDFLIFQK